MLPVPNREVLIRFARDMANNPNVKDSSIKGAENVQATAVLYAWLTTKKPELYAFAFTAWCSANKEYYDTLDGELMHSLLLLAYYRLAEYAHVYDTVH